MSSAGFYTLSMRTDHLHLFTLLTYMHSRSLDFGLVASYLLLFLIEQVNVPLWVVCDRNVETTRKIQYCFL